MKITVHTFTEGGTDPGVHVCATKAEAHAAWRADAEDLWTRHYSTKPVPDDDSELCTGLEAAGCAEWGEVASHEVDIPVAADTSKAILAVIMEGGLVQDIVTDRPELRNMVRVVVIDYDTEGSDDVIEIPQGGGGTAEAVVGERGILDAALPLDEVMRRAEIGVVAYKTAAKAKGWRRASKTEREASLAEFNHNGGEHSHAESWRDLCDEQDIDAWAIPVTG